MVQGKREAKQAKAKAKAEQASTEREREERHVLETLEKAEHYARLEASGLTWWGDRWLTAAEVEQKHAWAHARGFEYNLQYNRFR